MTLLNLVHFSVEKVSGQYKNLKGLTRGEAIVKYMSIIEKQPTYGVHFYEIKVCLRQQLSSPPFGWSNLQVIIIISNVSLSPRTKQAFHGGWV